MNVFDFLAPLYIPCCRLMFGREQHQLLPQSLEHVDIHQYSHIIVLGCGPGQNLPRICQDFSGDIVCIDNSPKMIQRAQRRVETSDGTKNNSSITWLCTDVFHVGPLLQQQCASNDSPNTLVIAEYFFDQFTITQSHALLSGLQANLKGFDLLNVDFTAKALQSNRMKCTALFFHWTGILETTEVVHVSEALSTFQDCVSSQPLYSTAMFESQLLRFARD